MPAELASPHGDGHRIETLTFGESAGWVARISMEWNKLRLLDSGGGRWTSRTQRRMGRQLPRNTHPNRNQCAGAMPGMGKASLGAITRQTELDVAHTATCTLSESGATRTSQAPQHVDQRMNPLIRAAGTSISTFKLRSLSSRGCLCRAITDSRLV